MSQTKSKGPISWMVHNPVTANLLMLLFLIGGLLFSTQIKKEVFPEFDLDMVTVGVSYPGASPEEVEQGIVLVIEEALRNIEGIEEVTATAAEGRGSVIAEISSGEDRQQIFQDIQQEVNAIVTFPEEAEKPDISINTRKRRVLTLALYGEGDEWLIRKEAERFEEALLAHPSISQVEMNGERPYQVTVALTPDTLERYGLSISEIASVISTEAVELGGGTIKSTGGEILVRFNNRRYFAEEFAKLPLLTDAGGQTITLGMVAEVTDGFDDSDILTEYNGKQAITFEVYRVGDATPIEVSDAVKSVMENYRLPPDISITIPHDMSDVYRQRLELLLKNAFVGLLLVLILLGTFLEFKLAFWVSMGIPTSFLGALLFLPGLDVSINMVSMFAFIVSLGIVVDDAIIAGENIYSAREKGMHYTDAAVEGARTVAVPITFSILTNIAAFAPMLMISGVMGHLMGVIPLVVITVFLISWVEALFILPAHLAHSEPGHRGRLSALLYENQQKVSKALLRFIDTRFKPAVTLAVQFRYITLALSITTFILVISYAASGRLGFSMMPKVESDRAVATATLPLGSTMTEAIRVRDRVLQSGLKAVEENGGEALLIAYQTSISENRIRINFYLHPSDERPLTTRELTQHWRKTTGTIPGLESLEFRANIGGPGGGQADLTVSLSHTDIDVLESASSELAKLLSTYSGLSDVQDGYIPGKKQYEFKLKPFGEYLGFTTREVARQVRSAVYGQEALRQQRGRFEVRTLVRLEDSYRNNERILDTFQLKTPNGGFVPLREVVEVTQGYAYTTISRRDGRRVVDVTANSDSPTALTQAVAALESDVFESFSRKYPGLLIGFEGQQADTRESMSSMQVGGILVFLVMYMLLAIPFRSYTQPLVVLATIPFGVVGAILGHFIMGFSLSLISIMGILALAGVVVNDSLVLVDYANQKRKEGMQHYDAIIAAGVRRFRPILLTTLTTFAGLAPMIFESSIQARFLIPMAISLGFGILFATFITLFLVPSLYLIVEDVTVRLKALKNWLL